MVGRELERGYPHNTVQKGEIVLELKICVVKDF